MAQSPWSWVPVPPSDSNVIHNLDPLQAGVWGTLFHNFISYFRNGYIHFSVFQDVRSAGRSRGVQKFFDLALTGSLFRSPNEIIKTQSTLGVVWPDRSEDSSGGSGRRG